MTSTLKLADRVRLYDLHPPLDDFRSEVLACLQRSPKAVAPKFLYDKQGAELFDAICQLDEYYLTRTEIAILQHHAQEIAALIGDRVLVEYGSGSSQKIKILLDAAPTLRTYVALDISKQHLYESCVALAKQYSDLETIAICADFNQPLSLPPLPVLQTQAKVAFFPGSSIGNLEPETAVRFLQTMADLLGPGGSLLIGVDLKKSPAILEPAYEDAAGVSAAFALNLLHRMNRELGANFNLDRFGYRACYQPEPGRIAMYIVSLADQKVRFEPEGLEIAFAAGETLRTEYSYKYTIPEFQALAAQAGFSPQAVWTDDRPLFSVHYFQLSG